MATSTIWLTLQRAILWHNYTCQLALLTKYTHSVYSYYYVDITAQVTR